MPVKTTGGLIDDDLEKPVLGIYHREEFGVLQSWGYFVNGGNEVMVAPDGLVQAVWIQAYPNFVRLSDDHHAVDPLSRLSHTIQDALGFHAV